MVLAKLFKMDMEESHKIEITSGIWDFVIKGITGLYILPMNLETIIVAENIN